MAIAKSTIKKPTAKVGRKVAGDKFKKASKQSAKTRAAKSEKGGLKSSTLKRVASKSARAPAKKSTVQRAVKAPSIKKMPSPNKVINFIAGISKQATKAQKIASAQCKALAKQASNLDKQCRRLSHKQSSAKAKRLSAIDKKLNKLRAQSAAVDASLLQAENNKSKIISLLDFVSKLNSNTAPSMT